MQSEAGAENLGPQSQAPSDSMLMDERRSCGKSSAEDAHALKSPVGSGEQARLGFHDDPAEDDDDELIDVAAIAEHVAMTNNEAAQENGGDDQEMKGGDEI